MSTWEKTLPTTGETNWGLKYNEAIGEIRNKVDNKIDTEHEFVINDITNLEAELNSKSNTDHDHSDYSAIDHTHSVANITGLAIQLLELSDEVAGFAAKTGEQMNLSVRGYQKMIRIARTIADYDGDERMTIHHIAQALQFRKKLLK